MTRFKAPTKEERKGSFTLPRSSVSAGVNIPKWIADASPAADPFMEFAENSQSVKPVRPPKSGDWLASRKESGQTLAAFFRRQHRMYPRPKWNVVLLQPVGPYSEDPMQAPPPKLLAQWLELTYPGMRVLALPPVPVDKVPGAELRGSGRDTQLKCGPVINWLGSVQKSYNLSPKRKTEGAAIGAVAVTMLDIYPDERYNFVFGLADAVNSAGIFSFARYHPDFEYEIPPPPSSDPAEVEAIGRTMTRRAFKVLSHEVGHLMGIAHCTHYSCLMNGSNHLDEMDAKTAHFCPLCLKKMAIAFSWTPSVLAERASRLGAAIPWWPSEEAYYTQEAAFWLENAASTNSPPAAPSASTAPSLPKGQRAKAAPKRVPSAGVAKLPPMRL